MEEKKGIKEVKEVMDFVEVVAVKMVKALKDGASLEDLKLVVDAEIWAKGKTAVDNVGEVVAEVKDLDFKEIAELGEKGYDIGKGVLDAFKE